MVVAVVSLVVALLCVLYVMERPGTIAIGSPIESPKGEIRVIDAYCRSGMYVGAPHGSPPSFYMGNKCNDEKRWDRVKVTVPEGKQWMVILAPAPWNPSWGSYPNLESSYGYYFECKNGEDRVRRSYLGSGTYDEVDLYIYNCWYNDGTWYWAGGIYLVVEVDEYYEVGE